MTGAKPAVGRVGKGQRCVGRAATCNSDTLLIESRDRPNMLYLNQRPSPHETLPLQHWLGGGCRWGVCADARMKERARACVSGREVGLPAEAPEGVKLRHLNLDRPPIEKALRAAEVPEQSRACC